MTKRARATLLSAEGMSASTPDSPPLTDEEASAIEKELGLLGVSRRTLWCDIESGFLLRASPEAQRKGVALRNYLLRVLVHDAKV